MDGLVAHACLLDGAGRILAVNRAWREFARESGGTTGIVEIGTSYLEACRAGAMADAEGRVDAARFAELLAEVLAGRSARFEYEYPCHSPRGRRWFVARVARIEGSEAARIVVAHDDVTALKLAEEAARRGEAMLADVAASLPGAMFRIHQWPDGRWAFDYVSPGFEALVGTPAEDARRDHRAMWSRVAPADRAALAAAVRDGFGRRQPWDHEYRVVLPEGGERWIHAKAAPRAAGDGNVLWTGFLHDITERKRIEAEWRASERTFRNLFETVAQGVVYQDRDGRITAANPAAQRILGLTLDQLQGRTSIDPRWQAVNEDGSPLPGEQHPAMVALRTALPVNDVVMGVTRPDGSQVWILVNATPVFEDGVLREVFASFEDISQRVHLAGELRRKAATDELTGLANRRSFVERLHAEFARLRRHPARQCSLVALDLDHFKQINDRLGHAAGDAVLAHAAATMRLATREDDVLARWGGEEFMVLLPDTGSDEALALAERLRQAIEAEVVHHGGREVRVTVSAGVATMTAADASAEAALYRADDALYQAKAQGRNRVVAA